MHVCPLHSWLRCLNHTPICSVDHLVYLPLFGRKLATHRECGSQVRNIPTQCNWEINQNQVTGFDMGICWEVSQIGYVLPCRHYGREAILLELVGLLAIVIHADRHTPFQSASLGWLHTKHHCVTSEVLCLPQSGDFSLSFENPTLA